MTLNVKTTYFQTGIILISLVLHSCSTTPPAPPLRDFVNDGDSNSFLEGLPTISKKHNGLDLEGLYTGHDENEKALTFKFKIYNNTKDKKIFSLQGITLEIKHKTDFSKKPLILSLRDPIAHEKFLQQQIKNVKERQIDSFDLVGNVTDIFTKETPAKLEREKKRKEDDQKFEEEIIAIENKIKKLKLLSLYSSALQPKESIAGTIYFTINDTSALSDVNSILVLNFPPTSQKANSTQFFFKAL